MESTTNAIFAGLCQGLSINHLVVFLVYDLVYCWKMSLLIRFMVIEDVLRYHARRSPAGAFQTSKIGHHPALRCIAMTKFQQHYHKNGTILFLEPTFSLPNFSMYQCLVPTAVTPRFVATKTVAHASVQLIN